jgi:hypothetical protein
MVPMLNPCAGIAIAGALIEASPSKAVLATAMSSFFILWSPKLK